MPQFEEYRHKGAVFQVSIPMEWDEFNDHIEFNGIKFSKMANLIGFFEIFARMDYTFGGLNDCIFIDVGANVADSTLYAASLENVKYVYAYEPFPTSFNMALKNISMNPELQNKISIYPYGWFSKNGIVSLDEIIDVNASAVNTVLTEYSPAMKPDKFQKVKIELKRASDILKTIINNHPDNPIILKMDIEGAEYDCIKELEKSGLMNKVDMVFIEWHKKGAKPITDILGNNGFIFFEEKLGSDVGFIRGIRYKG